MRRLTATICLTLAVLLGSAGVGWSADYQKGLDAAKRGDFATALREWKPLAEQGDADAQFNLGLMYGDGQGVPQNYETALKWFRLAAKQGHASAQSNLGVMYEFGDGVLQDDKTAVKWWRLAAEQGDADAQFNLGFMYGNGQGVPQDDKTAVKWYSLAAEQGHAEAQYYLGFMYDNGHGVPQSEKTALKWFRLAAKQGHTHAQYNLEILENRIAEQKKLSPTVTAEKTPTTPSGDFQKGWDAYENGDYATALREFRTLAEQGNASAQVKIGFMYEYGKGVPQNYKTASKFYRLAAEQGNALAQYYMGGMYSSGRGVREDYYKALKWYRLALKQGVTTARIEIENIQSTIARENNLPTVTAEITPTPSAGDYQKGLDAYKRYDYATALREFRPLAEQGHADAQYSLGVMYRKGPEWDDKTAMKWFTLAAEQGHVDAQYDLGEMYERAWRVPRNKELALKWYRLAAEQGHASAQLKMGRSYEAGRGVLQNYGTAVKWYSLAADQGQAYAQHHLGVMYQYGEGVPQNYATALKWYRLAAAQGDGDALEEVQILEKKLAEQQPSPTITAEKPKPKVDQQQRLELARRTQEALQVLGLYSGKLDGIIGVKTRSAIQQWQKRNGYAGTGEITEVQLAKLEQEAITQLAEKKSEPKVTAEKTPELKKKKPELAAIPSIEFGDYHALVIGNNDYPHMKNLKNAVQDAKDISTVLKRLYGFQVRTLLNATRSEIFGALESYRAELTSDSNLLIYYAGHGYVDEVTEIGYWQPVDATEISKSNWIPNSVVTNELKAIRAKHVMVIADSCYSGTLVRSSTKGRPTAKDTEWYKRMAEKRSRTAMVSGGFEPVMDGGGGKNSVFAKALLDVLRDNQSIMDGAEVFERLKRPVVLASEQTPEYADIRLAGHDGGQFLLVRQDAITEQPSVSADADALERAKKQCSELGFTMGTVEHGQCVMKLYK